MVESNKLIDLTPYQKKTRDHFVFLTVVLTSFMLSDFTYALSIKIFPSVFSKLKEDFLGDFTYPLIISMLMMTVARIMSELIPESNLNTQPSFLDFFGSILIITHPIRMYQAVDGLKIRFDIFGMIKNGEIIIFIISLLFYFFAVFGIQQILLVNDKSDGTTISYYIDLLYSDILPILATLFAIIYVGSSMVTSSLERIDLSMMIKMIFYILFSVASLPSVDINNTQSAGSQV